MFVLICLTGVAVLSWVYGSELGALGQVIPSSTVMPGYTIQPSENPAPAITQSVMSPTPEVTTSLVYSPTPTFTPTKPLIIGEPFGLETPSSTVPQLLIHRLLPGESLALLAKRYGTSVAAIRSVNYFLPVPLWEGVPVVIPLNTTDISNLPAFEPYQVKSPFLTMKDAASALNTSPELISLYNRAEPNAILPLDSWLLIPRPFPPPTGLPLETPDGKIQNDYGN